MQQTISINLYSQDGSSRQVVEVDADVVDNFAVHKALHEDGYAVTHVPTSLRMGRSKELSRILARREYLRSATVGGVPVANLPACEICANALLISAQLGAKEKPEAVLSKAAYVADILCRDKE